MNDKEADGLYRLPIDEIALWEGCMLALCVHAVMLPEYPFILNEHAWSNGIYLTKEGHDCKAALAFTDEKELVLGVFRDYSSPRIELVLTDWYARSHFKDAPEEIRDLAQALFVFFGTQVGEREEPAVTAGFWRDGGQIVSRDSVEDWYAHGGSILSTQMMGFEEAMEYYIAKNSMDQRRAEIAERIYREKIRSPHGQVSLTKDEINIISAAGPYNMEACERAFGEIGVIFEA